MSAFNPFNFRTCPSHVFSISRPAWRRLTAGVEELQIERRVDWKDMGGKSAKAARDKSRHGRVWALWWRLTREAWKTICHVPWKMIFLSIDVHENLRINERQIVIRWQSVNFKDLVILRYKKFSPNLQHQSLLFHSYANTPKVKQFHTANEPHPVRQ